jgi:hypothetical protein
MNCWVTTCTPFLMSAVPGTKHVLAQWMVQYGAKGGLERYHAPGCTGIVRAPACPVGWACMS